MHPPQILIASSAWKETLSPAEANQIMHEALFEKHPDWHYSSLPISDGGDGWLDTMLAAAPQAYETGWISVAGPIPKIQVTTRYLWSPGHSQILLETADIHGMRKLPQGQRYPLTATSYGVGEALRKLWEKHPAVKQFIISVGGSASTDGGIGFLQGLGWQFRDRANHSMLQPIGGQHLPDIQHAEPLLLPPNFPAVTVLTDVITIYQDSPILFGPQKGATAKDVEALSAGFTHIARCLNIAPETLNQAGTGAAGGLPMGILLGCPNVAIQSGMTWTAKALELDKAIVAADLIITGEGRLDETSFLGKGTGYLMQQAKALNKPLIIFCGQNALKDIPENGVIIAPLYPENTSIDAIDFGSTPAQLKKTVWATLSAIEQALA